jgi:hypothetical protein
LSAWPSIEKPFSAWSSVDTRQYPKVSTKATSFRFFVLADKSQGDAHEHLRHPLEVWPAAHETLHS